MLERPSLLLDIGNTSIKYAWYKYPNHIADLQVMRTTVDSLQVLINEASSCWFCSVIDEDSNTKINTNSTKIGSSWPLQLLLLYYSFYKFNDFN